MAGAIEVEIEGLAEALKKLSPDLYAEPLRKFWNRAAVVVQGRARDKSPVDTGRLRSSIMYEIDTANPPLYAVVGSDVEYAPYQEFGTSRGVPAVGYLSGGMRDSKSDIDHLVSVLGDEIAAKWSS